MYNFAEIPVVHSRAPRWEPGFPVARVVGLPETVPSTLVTRVHDAEPDHITLLPTPSVWPLLAAVATTIMFIGTVFTLWALVWGSVPIAVTLIGWFWPNREETERHRAVEIKPEEAQEREAALAELMS